ncbi:MAG: hypothetical protein ACREFF_14365 [Candidatus Udaeobacter sp.]
MATYRIAHLREQGQDMIIMPLESSFGYKSENEQHEFITALRVCARSAGLAGAVVPVWREGGGHRFIAPPPWHSFFRSLPFNAILANLNKELTCG